MIRSGCRAALVGLMVIGAALGAAGSASAAGTASSTVVAPAGKGATPNVWWYCQWIQTSPNGGQYWCERL